MSQITEVFDAEFRKVFEVPTSCVAHLPPARLNITRLVLCRNYRSGERDSCAMGANCKFVHADCDYAQLPTHSIHVNYVWRSEASCIYPRLESGATLSVYAPRLVSEMEETATEANVTAAVAGLPTDGAVERTPSEPAVEEGDHEVVDVVVASECVLRTAGALAATRAAAESEANAVDNTAAMAPYGPGKLRQCGAFCWQRICKRGEDCPDAHVLFIDPDAKEGHFKRAPVRALPAGARSSHANGSHKHASATATATATATVTAGTEHGAMPSHAEKERRRLSPPPAPLEAPHAFEQRGAHGAMLPPPSAPMAGGLHTPHNKGYPLAAGKHGMPRRDVNDLRLQWPVPGAAGDYANGRLSPTAGAAHEVAVLTPLQDSLSLAHAHMPTFGRLERSPPERPHNGGGMGGRLTTPPPPPPPPHGYFVPQMHQHMSVASVGAAGGAHTTTAATAAAGAYAGFHVGPHHANNTAVLPPPRVPHFPSAFAAGDAAGAPAGMDAGAREFYPSAGYPTHAHMLGAAPGHAPFAAFHDPAIQHMGLQTPRLAEPNHAHRPNQPNQPSHANYRDDQPRLAAAAAPPPEMTHAMPPSTTRPVVPAPRSTRSSGSSSAGVTHRPSPLPSATGAAAAAAMLSSSLPSTPLEPARGDSAFAAGSPSAPELSFRANRLAAQTVSVSNTYLSVTPNNAYLAPMYGSSVSTHLTPNQGYTPPQAQLNTSASRGVSKPTRQTGLREPAAAASSRMLMSASTLGHEGVPAMVLAIEEPMPLPLVRSVGGAGGSRGSRGSRVLCDMQAAALEAPLAMLNELSGALGASDSVLATGRSRTNLSSSNLSASRSVYRHNPYNHAEPRTVLTNP